MKVIVAGPRNLYVGKFVVLEALEQAGFTGLDTIVHGGAPGIDSCAEELAQTLGWRSEIYTADWNTHGRAAGPIRNRQMAQSADALVVIKRADRDSRGTNSMVREAKTAGLPIFLTEVGR